MGEIKSTLDLVMERTRHLSMSAEEKENQQRSDFEKRLQGVLQQYADGALPVRTLHERVAELQAELNITDPRMVTEGVFRRIDPDQDNQIWLDLLADVAPAYVARLQAILSTYNTQKAEHAAESKTRMLRQLARRYAVAGSAVSPNPQRDKDFQDRLGDLRRETCARIEAVADAA